MKCSAFIASSLDGYIASQDHSVEFLDTAGNGAKIAGDESMGFFEFIADIDCIIMGRRTVEILSSFDVTPEDWPYGNLPIYGMSNTLKTAPKNLINRVQMTNESVHTLVNRLTAEGKQHAYLDGGSLISSFIKHKLISDMTVTLAPVYLGSGIPMIKTDKSVFLKNVSCKRFENDFVQMKFEIDYRED